MEDEAIRKRGWWSRLLGADAGAAAAVEAELLAAREAVTNMEARLAAESDARDRADAQVARLAAALAESESLREDERAGAGRLAMRLEELDSHVLSATDRADLLEREKKAVEARVEEQATARLVLGDRLRRVQRELSAERDALTSERAKLSHERDTLWNQCDNLRLAVEVITAERDRREQERDELAVERSDAMERVQRLEADASNASAANQALGREARRLGLTLAELRAELDRVRTQLEAALLTRSALREETASLTARVEAIAVELASERAQLERVSACAEGAVRLFAVAMQGLDRCVGDRAVDVLSLLLTADVAQDSAAWTARLGALVEHASPDPTWQQGTELVARALARRRLGHE